MRGINSYSSRSNGASLPKKMRLSHVIAMSVLGVLELSAALIFISQSGAAEFENAAVVDPVRPIQQAQLRQAPAAPSAQPAESSAPKRVETTTYDSWAITCQETPGAQVKKSCLANMRIAGQNRQQVLLNWQIGYNRDGRYVTAVHVPAGMSVKKDNQTLGGGILLTNGIELKLGGGAARRLNYFACNPQQCFAELPIDDAFIKDALASTTATLTVSLPGVGAVPFEVSIKGIDKAISSTRLR